MRTVPYSFSIYKGDTYQLIFTVDQDVSAYTAKMDLKTAIDAVSAALSLTTANGKVTQTYSAITGLTTCTATISAADSAALSTLTYFFDYQWTLPDATVWTPIAGRISVVKDIS
jgi:hypothetical protein